MDPLIWFEWALKGWEGWANHTSTLSRTVRFSDSHLCRLEAVARQVLMIVARQRDREDCELPTRGPKEDA